MSLINIVLGLHAVSGGVGLLTGLMAILLKKGSKNHRLSGTVFSISMALCSISGIALAPLSGKYIFMAIGLFSGYMILTGYRAGKNLLLPPWLNRVFWFAGIASAIWMIASLNTIFIVFGIILGLFLFEDYFILFKQKAITYKSRIRLHIGRIMGAMITALTAFIVVNFSFATSSNFLVLLFWLGPTIFGTSLIIFYSRKYREEKK